MKPSPLCRLLTQRAANPTNERARALISAIDAGGIPLHPAKVNQIAARSRTPINHHLQADRISRVSYIHSESSSQPPWLGASLAN